MFLDFRDLAGMGIIGIFIIGFLVLMGAFAWPLLLAWVFLTWLAIQFCKG
jgi:hypothetical protein